MALDNFGYDQDCRIIRFLTLSLTHCHDSHVERNQDSHRSVEVAFESDQNIQRDSVPFFGSLEKSSLDCNDLPLYALLYSRKCKIACCIIA